MQRSRRPLTLSCGHCIGCEMPGIIYLVITLSQWQVMLFYPVSGVPYLALDGIAYVDISFSQCMLCGSIIVSIVSQESANPRF